MNGECSGITPGHLLCIDYDIINKTEKGQTNRVLRVSTMQIIENARIMLGDDIADKLQPLVYDIDKALSRFVVMLVSATD